MDTAAAELDRGDACAAAGPEHEERLASAQLGPILQRVNRSCIGEEQRGRILQRQLRRRRQASGGGQHDVLRHSAVGLDAKYALADLNVLHTGADGVDAPCNVAPRRERPLGFQLIQILDDEYIGIVDGAYLDAHANLPGCRVRCGYVMEREGLWTARGGAQDSFHLRPLNVTRGRWKLIIDNISIIRLEGAPTGRAYQGDLWDHSLG